MNTAHVILTNTIQHFLDNHPVSRLVRSFQNGELTLNDTLNLSEGNNHRGGSFNMRDDSPEPPQGMIRIHVDDVIPVVLRLIIPTKEIAGIITAQYQGNDYEFEVEYDSSGWITCWSPVFDILVEKAKQNSQM